MIIVWLLSAFILIPIAELALMLYVGRFIGLPGTLALVLVTGIAGAFVVKLQGRQVLARIHADWSGGRLPAPHLIDGVLILFAGAMLVTPGFITDGVGFLLLVPPLRVAIRSALQRKFVQSIRFRPAPRFNGPTILDVEADE